MTTKNGFDPFRAECILRWRNRIARCRDEAAQTAFHAFALLALAVLLLPLLRHGVVSLTEPALVALLRWPFPVALAALAAFAWRQARRRQALQQLERVEWWVAQPIPVRIRNARRRAWQATEAAAQLASGVLALFVLGAPPLAYAALLAIVAIALASSRRLAQHLEVRATRRARLASRLGDAGRGRLWRWQRIETGVALRGRALAYGLWALLLVPMGSGPGVVLVVLGAGLLLTMLATAWIRALAVLPQAHAWLRTQPVAGRRWLAAVVAVPAAVLGIATLLVAGVLVSLGTPGLAFAAALAILAVGALQFAGTFALRAQPRRIALHLAVHLVLLVGLLQAAAPLVVPAWVVQMAWLLRRGVRA